MTTPAPKLFISYSWTSSDHEDWVLSVAKELCEAGVDVILDKWELKGGQDVHAFMEKMVTDPEIRKVVLICDRQYAEKANKRSGGVGTEAQIISQEVYVKDQSKFVAVLRERDEDGKPLLPAYYGSKMYFDMSDQDHISNGMEELLRWVFDKPRYLKPELGSPPAFLSDSSAKLPTAGAFRRAIAAVQESTPNCHGALAEYFDIFAKHLERFRIGRTEGEFDEQVLRSIEEFVPYRNEVVGMFTALARHRPTEDSWEAMHRFFESLLPYLDLTDGTTDFRESDLDNFKFILQELFLYAIASLMRHECFSGVAYLVTQHYYRAENPWRSADGMVPFSVFSNHLESLVYRNSRLRSNRLSIHADLLDQRAKSSGQLFQQLMQADLVLFVCDCLERLRSESLHEWWPVTLVYVTWRPCSFEAFGRSQSSKYFEKVKQVFGIADKYDLLPLQQAFREGTLRVPQWGGESFNPFAMMCFDKWATRP